MASWTPINRRASSKDLICPSQPPSDHGEESNQQEYFNTTATPSRRSRRVADKVSNEEEVRESEEEEEVPDRRAVRLNLVGILAIRTPKQYSKCI